MSEDRIDNGAPPAADADESMELAVAEFLRELRRRGVDGETAERLSERLAPAVSRLTDRLVVLACDRLSRRDMSGFYETLLEGLSPQERGQWRMELTDDWRRAVLRRLEMEAALRREVLETILWIKALALA